MLSVDPNADERTAYEFIRCVKVVLSALSRRGRGALRFIDQLTAYR